MNAGGGGRLPAPAHQEQMQGVRGRGGADLCHEEAGALALPPRLVFLAPADQTLLLPSRARPNSLELNGNHRQAGTIRRRWHDPQNPAPPHPGNRASVPRCWPYRLWAARDSG